MPSKLVVTDLRKRYAGVEAARGVSFSVEAGEILGLLGPNGAGKTTTVECIVGLRTPDAGAIEVCGIDARRHPRDVKQKIGAALQTTALQDKLTPREALALFGSFYSRSRPPAQLLDRFGLTDKADAAFETLSGGQRQRLALALAFVNDPELALLDEPTAGLDPQSRRDLHAEIVKMKDDGHTVLLTTHYIEEAEALCDRIAIIDKGRVISTGSPRELIAQSSTLQTVSLTTTRALDAARLASLPALVDLECDALEVRFRTPDATKTLGALVALLETTGGEITELHVQKGRLEDVFLAQIATDTQA